LHLTPMFYGVEKVVSRFLQLIYQPFHSGTDETRTRFTFNDSSTRN